MNRNEFYKILQECCEENSKKKQELATMSKKTNSSWNKKIVYLTSYIKNILKKI